MINRIISAKKRPKRTRVDFRETRLTTSRMFQIQKRANGAQSQLVEKLLAELNCDQRACVVLRDIQGLSYEEIAQALSININTVRSRLKRAREKLLSLKKKVDYERV